MVNSSRDEVATRARVLYDMQLGYDFAQLNEPTEMRLSMVPHSLYIFTGWHPRPEDVAEFTAYARSFLGKADTGERP